MDDFLMYAIPFLKNLAILVITPWLMFLFLTLRRLGLAGFSFLLWLEDNKMRFQVGLIFIISLSALMALTDVSPLFKFIGFDINASPVGLGIAIGTALLVGIPVNPSVDGKADKIKDIQVKANEIIKTSTEIPKDDTK